MDKRRLSAIMFTDIVGYTRKMGENEVKMLKLLQDHGQIVKEAVEKHEGEIIQRIGDAFLMRFDSATDSVLCAIEIQNAHKGYNEGKDEADQVHIRIGIHLGDIVIREGDVFGDGVNVAARIEPLANTDGICITRAVYDMVKKKMTVKAVELGLQQLKNVDEAIEVFHLLSETVGIKELRKTKRLKKRRVAKPVLYISLAVIVLVISLVLQRFVMVNEERVEGGLDEILKLVENVEVSENRVAVLPLRNITGSDENQAICNGIIEDLIFRLAKVKELHVYPFETIQTLKDKDKNSEGVRKMLGATYMITGSVEPKNDSLLVLLELFNTGTNERQFSKKYEEANQNRANLQERLAIDVFNQVIGQVTKDINANWKLYYSENPIANNLYQEALQSNSSKERISLLESALSVDSNFAAARVMLAIEIMGSDRDKEYRTRVPKMHLDVALKVAPNLPELHLAYAITNFAIPTADTPQPPEWKQAETSLIRAIELQPSSYWSLFYLGKLYYLQERWLESASIFEQHSRVAQKFGDRRGEILALQARMPYWVKTGNFQKSLECTERMLAISREINNRSEEWVALLMLAVTHYLLGDLSNAYDLIQQDIALAKELNLLEAEHEARKYLSWILFAQGKIDSAYLQAKESRDLMLIGRLLYKKGMYAEARDSLMKAEHGFKSLYLGAIDVKQDKVDTGLKLMRSALESTEHYVEKVVAHREIAEILIDLGRKEEAKQHLEEGHAMAEKSGMKGEIKKYDDLMERLKEI